MEELKTLKEIFEKSKYKDIIERELKAEAIKWIKKMQKTKCYVREDQEDFDAGDNMKEDLLRYFAEFFNITSEDLK